MLHISQRVGRQVVRAIGIETLPEQFTAFQIESQSNRLTQLPRDQHSIAGDADDSGLTRRISPLDTIGIADAVDAIGG